MLQQGVAAHNSGNPQEAERLYRAIIQFQPAHPDANYNLGVLAVSVNKADAALPLFKTAVEANPAIEQFWLSYIETLITQGKFEDAKKALKKGKKKGVTKENLKRLTQKLVSVKAGDKATQVPSQVELQNLVNHYQNGKYGDAEKLAISLTQQFPSHSFSWKILGGIYKALGRMTDALDAAKKSVELDPDDNQAHNSLGVMLEDLGRFEKAEASYKKAILLKPDDCGAYYNLGNTMRKLVKFKSAVTAYRLAISVEPGYAEAHSNLGITLKALGSLEEAEASCREAIKLKPDYADAYNNLGVTLQEVGRLEEAEAGYRHAIALKPDLCEAHYSLGNTLRELGRLEEAEASLRQAIVLKPDCAVAQCNLGILLHVNEDIDAALEKFEKATSIDPELEVPKLILSVLRARKAKEKNKASISRPIESSSSSGLTTNPLVLTRKVEPGLISTLSEVIPQELDQTLGPRYGNGRCSSDKLFHGDNSVIEILANDLTNVMKLAVKSEIYVLESFLNIYGAGAGVNPHNHETKLDKEMSLNLGKQKYSLAYYLSVGDQDCSDPGFLKLYDPEEKILPAEGMIVIFPASRIHSAVYGGKTDRVMVGVNFYSL